jgi:tape measure domain-containing protein
MAKDLQYILSLKDLFSKQMRGAFSETNRMDGVMGSLQNKLLGLGAGLSLASFGKSIFDNLRNYEYFSTALRTMMHGDRLASGALETQLVSLAKTSPFELSEVQDATKRLMAYGVAGGEVVDKLRMLGNVSAGLGKQSLPFLITAFGQIRSKGHLAGQELNQLTEQGFNPLNIIAKKTGKSYSELLKEMEKGKITFKDVDEAFKTVTASGGQFFNLMDEQSRTVGGKWSNLSDIWTQIQVNIGKSQSGIISGTIDFITKMADTLNKKLSAENFMDEALAKQGLQHGTMAKFYNDYLGLKSTGFAGNRQEMKTFSAEMQSMLESTKTAKDVVQNFEYLRDIQKRNAMSSKTNEEKDFKWAIIKKAQDGLTGAWNLLKSKPTDTKLDGLTDKSNKLSSLGKSATSSGVNISAQRPQSLVINITELVHELKIQANDLKDSTIKIKEEVTKIFLEMVNEANLAAR